MKLRKYPSGYKLWLSTIDTYHWANTQDNLWPCSQLSGKRIFVAVDNNGVYEFTVSGKHQQTIDNNELVACITDHLPVDLKQFWPCWKN